MGVPVTRDAVVHNHICVLGKRIGLHAATNDVHGLRCSRNCLELRNGALQCGSELRQSFVIMRRLFYQLDEGGWEVRVVCCLALKFLVIRVGAIQVRDMGIGFEGGDQRS